jgi:hypothetical protein
MSVRGQGQGKSKSKDKYVRVRIGASLRGRITVPAIFIPSPIWHFRVWV